ncbi:hypothetical protein R1sor_026777 [Riccia sorocarpa]|uniref:Reverse transcriptase domain-containing protein n=1 Tax=Riccia sorocarpa TaxID=122646 RepID=A0ABD3GEH5_9MARC
MVRTANNSCGGLHGACPSVDIQIGGIKIEQRVFVQEGASFPIILGQPFITAVRMETKVLDYGSAYARIRSRDNKNTVQFLTVPVNHERNREQLRRIPLPPSVDSLPRWERKMVRKIQKEWREYGVLEVDEEVDGVYEASGLGDTLTELEEIGNENEDMVVQVHSNEQYSVLESFRATEVLVETKYKTVAKKVKPVAIPLLGDSREQIERVSREKSLRDRRKGGHTFTEKTLDELGIGTDGTLLQAEKMRFRKMLRRHGKAFAFEPHEIGCVDPSVVPPMIVFSVPHAPWNLRPILVPKALLPKLLELLKEKMRMRILEPSLAPYSSRWFTVPKKNSSLRFIQDMQPMNVVTIRNAGVGPIVDEYAEAFAGRAIYSMGDLYSGYDQFQIAEGSRDLTTIKTPLGLVRMCTLPQCAKNSVAHMMHGMNIVLRDFIPEKTMPFLDDVPIKGCCEQDKDEILDQRGCRKFVTEHIEDCEKILRRLEEVNLTLSGTKSVFGVREVVIVGHLCSSSGRKPDPVKIEAIKHMKEVLTSLTEVRRFLGMCIFYHIWIPHYAHIAEPLYGLCRKGQRFGWEDEHIEAMQKLKALLSSSPVLGRIDYKCDRPVILTVDTSPIAIG